MLAQSDHSIVVPWGMDLVQWVLLAIVGVLVGLAIVALFEGWLPLGP